MKFSIETCWPEVFTREVFEAVLARGTLMGLGQWRTGSYGRFTYTFA